MQTIWLYARSVGIKSLYNVNMRILEDIYHAYWFKNVHNCICTLSLSLSLSLFLSLSCYHRYLVDRLTVSFMYYCCILHIDAGDDFDISTCLRSDPVPYACKSCKGRSTQKADVGRRAGV